MNRPPTTTPRPLTELRMPGAQPPAHTRPGRTDAQAEQQHTAPLALVEGPP